MKRRLIAIVMAMLLLLTCAGCGEKEGGDDVKTTRDNTVKYLQEKVPEPILGSVGGEWTVIGLSRANAAVPDGYYETYYDNVRATVKSKKGVLNEVLYTDYARVSLALKVIGKDPTKVEGYDLLKPLDEHKKVIEQGINGPAYALIAAKSCDYNLKSERRYLEYILKAELRDGGFSLDETEEEARADVTGMVLQALSFYKEDKKAAATIDRTVEKLAAMQKKDGTFDESSESLAQAIMGLAAVGVDPQGDKRFVKEDQTLYDVLMKFHTGEAFSHELNGEADLMPTDQALCALDAMVLYGEGKSLY